MLLLTECCRQNRDETVPTFHSAIPHVMIISSKQNLAVIWAKKHIYKHEEICGQFFIDFRDVMQNCNNREHYRDVFFMLLTYNGIWDIVILIFFLRWISQFTEYRNTGAKKETFYEIKYPSVLTAAMKMNERIFNSLYLENE